jgi:CRP-like cAMP-binding protein
MPDFSALLRHLAPHITLTAEEEALFVSQLKLRTVKRKQFIEQPGYVSTQRTYVVKGALRAFAIGTDGQEHTLVLAVEDWFIDDLGSFLRQEPAQLYVEALEDSTLIQWSYESEQLLLRHIPRFANVLLHRTQQVALLWQRRVISQLSLSAEARYAEFATTYPTLVQRLPLYLIASYLGMTREFLSKIRNQKSGGAP